MFKFMRPHVWLSLDQMGNQRFIVCEAIALRHELAQHVANPKISRLSVVTWSGQLEWFEFWIPWFVYVIDYRAKAQRLVFVKPRVLTAADKGQGPQPL